MTQAAHETEQAVRRTSDIIFDLAQGPPTDAVAVADIIMAFGDRSFGLAMLLLAAVNCVPLPMPVGVSTPTGAVMMVFAVQLALGRPRPWLPARVLARTMRRSQVARVARAIVPRLRRIERVLRPRLPALVEGAGERVAGWACVVLAALLMLPIPFANFLPAVAIVLFSLGIVEKDGVLVAIAYVAMLAALAWIAAIGWVAILAALMLVGAIFE